MRTPIIAANWKMNKTNIEGIQFADVFKRLIDDVDGVEIVLCVPFTSLKSLLTVIDYDKPNFSLGAQNVFQEESGAYTGEISAAMLKDLHVKYCIVGHSERRQYFAESSEIVNKKARQLINYGITPILCVGESLEQFEAGKTKAVLTEQVFASLEGLKPSEVAKMVIAYEPIWAIGTGRTASSHDAGETIGFIRDLLAERFGSAESASTRILYGGSVNPSNIKELMDEIQIDGALVGGASLESQSFSELCKFKS